MMIARRLLLTGCTSRVTYWGTNAVMGLWNDESGEDAFMKPCRHKDEFKKPCINKDEFKKPCRNKDEFKKPCRNMDEFKKPGRNKDEFKKPCRNKDEFKKPCRNKDEFKKLCRNKDEFKKPCRNKDEFKKPCRNKDELKKPCRNKDEFKKPCRSKDEFKKPCRTCTVPEAGAATVMVDSNITAVQYSCRAGYKLESGNLLRLCDVNGTWTGIQPVCGVDSILPKAYLVILIVGATIAVFLACIPYDFYRFRKRKKKVRDHQERLSLVTRIAPGHAKVVVETVPAEEPTSGNLLGRKMRFKSLFSVFRFVGGKMKSPQGQSEATSPMCADDKNSQYEIGPHRSSLSDAAPESDGATTSSYIFSPQLAPTSLVAHDVIDFCSVTEDKETFPKDLDPVEDLTTTEEDEDIRRRSSSPLVFDNNEEHRSGTQKKAFQLFRKANEILIRDLDSHRNPMSSASRRSVPNVDDPLMSEPATVEVTSMNEASSSAAEHPRGITQDEFPSGKVGFCSSSTSSLDVTPLRKADTKGEHFRPFHYPKGKSSVAYHSMPTITDIP